MMEGNTGAHKVHADQAVTLVYVTVILPTLAVFNLTGGIM